ncbi:MAG: tetratricopeptide repeat protein [Dehalococcoidia bacterium]|nr:tetratricopeptide repeat protein [Dehalococcoidia bacterium]
MDKLGFQIEVRIVPGIETLLPFDSAGAALLLAELYQRADRIGEAADLVEGLAEAGMSEPLARVSLAELYASSGRWEDAVRVTDGVTNTDDLSALTLSYRGAALGALGQFDESLAALREALKSRSRSAPVLHSARYHRARVYEELGQPGRARQDYDAIYAQNPNFADVGARLGR